MFQKHSCFTNHLTGWPDRWVTAPKFGKPPAAAARELTKLHEEVVRGTLDELAARFSDASIKGEFVLVIDRRGYADDLPEPGLSLAARVGQLEDEGMDHKAALKAAAREFGISRSEAYRQLQVPVMGNFFCFASKVEKIRALCNEYSLRI